MKNHLREKLGEQLIGWVKAMTPPEEFAACEAGDYGTIPRQASPEWLGRSTVSTEREVQTPCLLREKSRAIKKNNLQEMLGEQLIGWDRNDTSRGVAAYDAGIDYGRIPDKVLLPPGSIKFHTNQLHLQSLSDAAKLIFKSRIVRTQHRAY
ncbi:hypothetical protein GE061_006398 [Apolygus lucorum]|uniref:Uncharacterized protein n=1 Tax=Apolygus lucorum TaxID=248454 RepID=A0A8S9WTV0_APOLU|nr:hypothetical protein GE061_006398 [Apolygus lucorum]